jgi:monofunctional biosynthetic peptidoglycan transglycosylase
MTVNRSRLRHALIRVAGGVILAPAALCLLFAVVPVPPTPLMLVRAASGADMVRDWTPIESISPHLAAAVVAAEDTRFCSHHGFDLEALTAAWRGYRSSVRGRRLRGGSTISQQTVKNVFLWPDRSWARKALEAWLTIYAETIWSKRRMLEIYLNVAEWGDGVYGAEAAARKHFGKAARELIAPEAARLAAVLPNPRRWSPSAPGPYVAGRAATIGARATSLGPLLACVQ